MKTATPLTWKDYAAAFSGGLLLALPYLLPQLFLLSWIAFVPLLVVSQNRSWWQLYRLGLTFGLGFYPVAAYWIPNFIILFKGYPLWHTWLLSLLFWLYCCHQPVVLLMGLRLLQRWTRLHPVLLFPLLATFVYSFYPMVFSIQLGESQSKFLSVLQGIEFTGIYGLDFLIGLVNMLFFHHLTQTQPSRWVTALTTAVVLAWLGFGLLSVQWWDKEVEQWQTVDIGFVQPNESPSVEVPPPAPGFSRGYPPEMAYTEALVAQGANIVIWPETRYKGYYRYSQVASALRQNADRLDTYLVFQDNERTRESGTSRYYNAATLLGPEGQHLATYRKTERVAFGEYLPVFDENPVVKQWVKDYLGEFFIDFSAGNQASNFSLPNVTLAPIICYESLIPGYVARALTPESRGKLITVLSNNGWFGTTLQPYGHLHGSIMRTVENRLPMLHVMNNGPSSVVMPNGRVLLQTDYHRSMAALVAIPYNANSGGSFFNRYPNAFLYCLAALLMGALLINLIARLRKSTP